MPVSRLSKRELIWTPEDSDGISRFPGRRTGLCLYELWHHQKPLVSRELVRTGSWHPCSDLQKRNVKACISWHPQSLSDVCSQVKCVSAQLIHNCRQVRLSCFANTEEQSPFRNRRIEFLGIFFPRASRLSSRVQYDFWQKHSTWHIAGTLNCSWGWRSQRPAFLCLAMPSCVACFQQPHAHTLEWERPIQGA